MAKVIASRRIPNNFDIVDYLESKGYQFHNHFSRYDQNINGWEVWTLHVPKEQTRFDNYAIGLKGNKFVLIDPEELVFNRAWLGELLR